MDSFSEIKAAVRAGKTVCWKNDGYRVVLDRAGCQWLIGYLPGTAHENWVGLHEPSYDPADFYIQSPVDNQPLPTSE